MPSCRRRHPSANSIQFNEVAERERLDICIHLMFVSSVFVKHIEFSRRDATRSSFCQLLVVALYYYCYYTYYYYYFCTHTGMQAPNQFGGSTLPAARVAFLQPFSARAFCSFTAPKSAARQPQSKQQQQQQHDERCPREKRARANEQKLVSFHPW